MKTCFFIGHRDAPENLYNPLLAAIERHITEYGVTDFVVGRYGNFVRLAARTVIEAKQHHSGVKLTLLIPYYRTNTEPLPDGFDDSLFPDGLETVPKRAAILRANQYMIHHCDYMIVCDTGRIGNTRKLAQTRRAISRKDVIDLLHINGPQACRLLQKLVDEHELVREGNTSAARYIIPER